MSASQNDVNIAQNELFKTIELLCEQYISKMNKADETIECTIIDISDAANHKYKVVTSNKIKLDVQSENTDYKLNDRVQVLIPQGNYNGVKRIIGKCYSIVDTQESTLDHHQVELYRAESSLANKKQLICVYNNFAPSGIIVIKDYGTYKYADTRSTLNKAQLQINGALFEGSFNGILQTSEQHNLVSQPPSKGQSYYHKNSVFNGTMTQTWNFPSTAIKSIITNRIQLTLPPLTFNYDNDDKINPRVILYIEDGYTKTTRTYSRPLLNFANSDYKVYQYTFDTGYVVPKNISVQLSYNTVSDGEGRADLQIHPGVCSIVGSIAIEEPILLYSDQHPFFENAYNNNLIMDANFSATSLWLSSSETLKRAACAYNKPTVSGKTQIAVASQACALYEDTNRPMWSVLHGYTTTTGIGKSFIDLESVSSLNVAPVSDGAVSRYNNNNIYSAYGVEASLISAPLPGINYHLSFTIKEKTLGYLDKLWVRFFATKKDTGETVLWANNIIIDYDGSSPFHVNTSFTTLDTFNSDNYKNFRIAIYTRNRMGAAGHVREEATITVKINNEDYTGTCLKETNCAMNIIEFTGTQPIVRTIIRNISIVSGTTIKRGDLICNCQASVDPTDNWWWGVQKYFRVYDDELKSPISDVSSTIKFVPNNSEFEEAIDFANAHGDDDFDSDTSFVDNTATFHYQKQGFSISNLMCCPESEYKELCIEEIDTTDGIISTSGTQDYDTDTNFYWARWYFVSGSSETYFPILDYNNPFQMIPQWRPDYDTPHTQRTFRAKIYRNGEMTQTNDYTFIKKEWEE